MHTQKPSESPRLAAEDLDAIGQFLSGLAGLSIKRGKPLPVNRVQYYPADLESMAARAGQVAQHFREMRSDENAGKNQNQPATPKKAKVKMRDLTAEEEALVAHLEPEPRGQARGIIVSSYGGELWPMVEDGTIDLLLAYRLVIGERDSPSGLNLDTLLWCWDGTEKKQRQQRRQGAMSYGDPFVALVKAGTAVDDAMAICKERGEG